MPQDIPLEASETLVFTPPSIATAEGAPNFTLRAATTREKRFRRRLLAVEGLAYHSEEDLRAEILNALQTSLWGAEKFATHSQPLKDYWSTLDDFRNQRKDQPDLEWSYDPEIEKAVLKLLRDVEQVWKPLGEMKADNIDFNEIFAAATVAVIVQSWTGIDLKPDTDRGYLTVDCVDALAQRLSRFAQKHADPQDKDGVAGRLAWMELVNACSGRMALDEDEEKNSVSPSLSETSPAPSTETEILEADGAFLAAVTNPTPSTETQSDL